MAIYSCNLRSIGRTTHAPGTGGAHIRYICREDAEPVILANHIPSDPAQARTWLDGKERASRKNARVIDKIRIALPRELSQEQRAALVERFMADLGGERIPWIAAIHQSGDDAHNPHVHIAVHDRDIDTGKRLLRLSDNARDRTRAGLPGPKAVVWIRERWEIVCNKALATAGQDARIDRRTLEEQGIDRKPTIHEGPRGQHIDRNVQRPVSQERINGCGRVIDYPFIDEGRTRREFNAAIIALNLKQAARSKNPVASAWAQFEAQQQKLDQALEAVLRREQRARTEELRLAGKTYSAKIARLRAETRLRRRQVSRRIRSGFEKHRLALRERHLSEKQQLRQKQSRLHLRIFATLDFTGITRRRQEAARKALSKIHRAERRTLAERREAQLGYAGKALRARADSEIEKVRQARLSELSDMKEAHRHAEHAADRLRQAREAERERHYEQTEQQISAWKEGKTGGGRTSAAFAKAAQRARQKEEGRARQRGRRLGRER